MADDGLTAGAVARRLGVAVTTLRTWHQRYGLGPSEHVPGHHRRYTTQDLDRLEVMRRLTAQGVPPAEAAAWATRTPLLPGASLPAPAPAPVADHPLPPAGGAGTDGARIDGAGTDGARIDGARAGGGQVIPLGSADPAARGLARAAMRLDAASMRDILEMVVSQTGVIAAWENVIMPVLIGIGERYQATKRFVEVEHLLSRAVTEVLGAVPRPPGGVPPRVLLAAADEEQHTLPLEALAAALAETGVPTRLLGARVPPGALTDAIARTGPAVVVLWSQTPHTGDAAHLTRVSEVPHPPLMVAAAGPGWPAELPPGVTRLTGLAEAVRLLHAAR